MQNRQTGFTLIELMIAIAIVGILAAVAVPQYGKYMTNARRTDAHIELRAGAQQIERCRTKKFKYETTCFTEKTSNDGHYTIKFDGTPTANAFTLQAVAITGGAQANDTGCTTMKINQKGETLPAPATADCW